MADALEHYSILKVALPSSPKLSLGDTEPTQTLYVRPHEPKLPTPTSSRSLFIVNIPVDTTVAHLKLLLTCDELKNPSGEALPKVTHVSFEDTPATRKSNRKQASKKRKRKVDGDNNDDGDDDPLALTLPPPFTRILHNSGSTAVVVYASEHDAKIAYRAIQRAERKDIVPPWPLESALPAGVPPLGLERYKAHLEAIYPPHDKLQAMVDEYMTNLAAHEQAQARAAARARAVPDQDGFVTVTRGGRTGPARRHEAEEALAAQQAKEEKKRNSMSGDFYRFQVREKRKQREKELHEQFQSDVRRMRDLK